MGKGVWPGEVEPTEGMGSGEGGAVERWGQQKGWGQVMRWGQQKGWGQHRGWGQGRGWGSFYSHSDASLNI